MERNTVFAVVLSMLVIIAWYMFFQSPSASRTQTAKQQTPATQATAPELNTPPSLPKSPTVEILEKDITIETPVYKVVFTNLGAAVKHWYLKEKNGTLTDLVLTPETPVLTTLPGTIYSIEQPKPTTVVFSHNSPFGWNIKKTYTLSQDYLHSIIIE
jgi:cytoskeletal protein RodZ